MIRFLFFIIIGLALNYFGNRICYNEEYDFINNIAEKINKNVVLSDYKFKLGKILVIVGNILILIGGLYILIKIASVALKIALIVCIILFFMKRRV